MSSQCDHILGLHTVTDDEDGDCWESTFEVSDIGTCDPDNFQPFKFCPSCGADVKCFSADIEKAIRAKRDAELRQWEAERPEREARQLRQAEERERERIARDTPPTDPQALWLWTMGRESRHTNLFADLIERAKRNPSHDPIFAGGPIEITSYKHPT